MSRNDEMKMKLYQRKLYSKTTLSNLWNVNFLKTDMYNQFLNRVAGNTKIFQGKTFIRTTSYNLSYLKETKSNPSLSLLVNSFRYDKWKPILISDSLISFQLLWIKQIQNYEMIVELPPPLPHEIQIFKNKKYIFWNEWKCVVCIQAVAFTLLTKVI